MRHVNIHRSNKHIHSLFPDEKEYHQNFAIYAASILQWLHYHSIQDPSDTGPVVYLLSELHTRSKTPNRTKLEILTKSLNCLFSR